MNNLLFTIALLLLTGSAPLIAQNNTREQLTVPLTDPGKPGSLEVGLINGFIHIVGYSGKDVQIEALSGSGSTNRPEESGDKRYVRERVKVSPDRRTDGQAMSEGMKRISTDNSFDLSAEERNNRVAISASSHRRPVNLVIRVPQRFSLKLSTINHGDITVENVTGELEINNVNGPIELTNISGSAVAQTVNGNLKASFREVNTNTPMAFSTLNGRVDVTFPASTKANVKLKSDRGDVFSDFDIDIDKGQPKATRSNQSGMYRVTVEDWIYGKINNGGPEVMMKSMMGNVYVRKAK